MNITDEQIRSVKEFSYYNLNNINHSLMKIAKRTNYDYYLYRKIFCDPKNEIIKSYIINCNRHIKLQTNIMEEVINTINDILAQNNELEMIRHDIESIDNMMRDINDNKEISIYKKMKQKLNKEQDDCEKHLNLQNRQNKLDKHFVCINNNIENINNEIKLISKNNNKQRDLFNSDKQSLIITNRSYIEELQYLVKSCRDLLNLFTALSKFPPNCDNYNIIQKYDNDDEELFTNNRKEYNIKYIIGVNPCINSCITLLKNHNIINICNCYVFAKGTTNIWNLFFDYRQDFNVINEDKIKEFNEKQINKIKFDQLYNLTSNMHSNNTIFFSNGIYIYTNVYDDILQHQYDVEFKYENNEFIFINEINENIKNKIINNNMVQSFIKHINHTTQ